MYVLALQNELSGSPSFAGGGFHLELGLETPQELQQRRVPRGVAIGVAVLMGLAPLLRLAPRRRLAVAEDPGVAVRVADLVVTSHLANPLEAALDACAAVAAAAAAASASAVH